MKWRTPNAGVSLFDPTQNFFQFCIRIIVVISRQQTGILKVQAVKSVSNRRYDLRSCHRGPQSAV
jgi:hypothetical protein